MLVSLALPVVLSGVALFFVSFLSWMILQLHKKDWNKLPNENEICADLAKHNVPLGSYVFPYADSATEMKSEAFQKRYDQGPRGALYLYPKTNMGLNLLIMIVYFIVTSFIVAYLASIAFKPGTEFMEVFRFVFTATWAVQLAAMVPQSVWFKNRIAGHVIESLAYAVVSAAIFAAMWPK